MKIISPELAMHLGGEVTTLATCWKLTRTDAVVLGFTDHDSNLVIDSVTYQAASGFTPSAVATTSNLSVDNLDIEGVLDSGNITESDILAGKYDFAEIEIFKVNYADLSQGALQLRRGWLGEVSVQSHRFVAELRGLTQRLSQTIGELYGPSCRARFGDGHCKVNLETFTHTGSISTVVDTITFQDTSRTEEDGVFAYGKLTFTSGLNTGLSMEVKEYITGQVTLALPMPHAMAAADTYTLSEGCDKTLTTCRQRFNNVLNFRGEPHVPGLDKILQTAGTRSDW